MPLIDEQTERPRSVALVAPLLAAFAVIAAVYAALIAEAVLPFNSGVWAVSEEVATRGWLAYLLSACIHAIAAFGLWRRWGFARWLSAALLAVGLLPAVPGISSAVVDVRIPGIALWGALIVLRSAALYMLLGAD